MAFHGVGLVGRANVHCICSPFPCPVSRSVPRPTDELNAAVAAPFLAAFLTFAKNTPRRFRFVLTSRNDAKFEKIFASFEHAPLVHACCLDTSTTIDDIRCFAASELRAAVAPDDLEAACDELAHAVQGSFLLARMLLADLRSGSAGGSGGGNGGGSGGGGGDKDCVDGSASSAAGACTGRDVSSFLASYFLRLQTRADARSDKNEVRARPSVSLSVHVAETETVAAAESDSSVAVGNVS